MWLLVFLAGHGADNPPAAAKPPLAPIKLTLENATWQAALDQVAGPLGLKVRLDVAPPGTITYTDNVARPPAEALDVLHGVLLERGIALVQRQGQLVALRLADETQLSFASFVPLQEIRARKDSLFVITTIKLNSLLAQDAKAELTGFLSPRGKMVNTTMDNRIAVCDRADNIRALAKVLEKIDPPGQSATMPLKSFVFQYGNASEAANVARELLGIDIVENDGLATSIGGLANQAFTGKNARRVGRMFAPGMMNFFGGEGGGGGGEPTEKETKVHLSVDAQRNTLFVHGPFDKIKFLEPLLKALDAPPTAAVQPGVRMDLRVFSVTTGDGNDVAKSLKKAMAGIPGLVIAGSKDKVIVKGPKDRLSEVSAMFDRLNPASMQYAAFPTGDTSAKLLAKQLAKLFESDAEATRPLLAAAADDQQLVVRGTAAQVARLGAMMRGIERPKTVISPAPKQP